MANIDSEAIRGSIAEALEGALEGIRAVDDGEAENDLFEGASDSTRALKAMVRPVFTVNITEISRHPDSPMGPTSLFLYAIKLAVRATYNLQGPLVTATDYEDRKAVAEDHADKFAQALTWPNALDTHEESGRATGIVSGRLISDGVLYGVKRDDPDAGIYETEHNYAAIVQVTAATS